MKNIIIYEEYNITSNELINIMISPKYYEYLLSVTDDLLSYNIISLKKDHDFIYMELSYQLLIKLPYFLKKIFKNVHKFDFNESIIYNLKEKTVHINIYSKYFKLGKCTCNYNYKLIDIDEDKVSKETQFHCNCSIPIIGNRIENIMCNKTKEKNKDRYRTISEYIKIYNKEPNENI